MERSAPRSPPPDSSSSSIPDAVAQFIKQFRRAFLDTNLAEIHNLYQYTFTKLSERFYATSPWPSGEAVAAAGLVEDAAESFVMFYKELVFRHVYGKLQPTLAQRLDAWDNYCDLFNFFLDGGMIGSDLPVAWLWDITDEFVYQFEEWSTYRAKLKHKSPEEIAYLRDNDHIWNVNTVLQFLHTLVNKSNICPWLLNNAAPVGSDDPDSEEFDLSSVPVYRYLGYFSIISLLRIHCLLGDYRLALMVLQPLDFGAANPLFSHVSACHIALYYYMGFANLMLRKYETAVAVFSSTLLQFGRIKQFHTRSYQFDQINKRNDQMLSLLAICLALTLVSVDESIASMLAEKLTPDRLAKLARGDASTFSEVFAKACPKFISPAPPDYDVVADSHLDAPALQIKLFMSEIRQHLLLPQIRSYLRLYTAIEIPKLASFMALSERDTRAHLMCLKQKSVANAAELAASPVVGVEGRGRADRANAEVHFYIDGNVVQISEAQKETHHGEFFMAQIERLERMCEGMEKLLPA